MSCHDGEILEMRTNMFLSKINIKLKAVLIIILMASTVSVFSYADETDQKTEPRAPVLKQAVLCESIKDSKIPINGAVVFSSDLGELFCFTNFEPVYEETVIIHRYYFKDKFSSRKRLKLYPPSWAVRSRIQLRETDKGPWRVDITDADGKVLHSIRFSITD